MCPQSYYLLVERKENDHVKIDSHDSSPSLIGTNQNDQNVLFESLNQLSKLQTEILSQLQVMGKSCISNLVTSTQSHFQLEKLLWWIEKQSLCVER